MLLKYIGGSALVLAALAIPNEGYSAGLTQSSKSFELNQFRSGTTHSIFDQAYGARKKAAAKAIKANLITRMTVLVKVNKKNVKKKIACYKGNSGVATKIKGGFKFTTYKALAKTRIPKNTAALYKALNTTGGLACRAGSGGNPIPPSAVTNMSRYAGVFGPAQARRLVEVFALGGRPGLADTYAAIGMDAAINDLTAIKDDSAVEAFRAKLVCGPNPRRTSNPDLCFRDGNINDFYLDGAVAGINWRMIYSNNPAYMKLFQFAMDERAPANPRVLDGENRWMFLEYLAKVDRFMVSGDYKAFVAEMVTDPLQHGKWLSGATNHQGLLRTGNEDYGREAMELMTTGVYKPDGSEVYNDLDVFEASRIMSGFGEIRVTDSAGNGVKAIGFFPALHTAGLKRLFAGTPQEMVADRAEDFAREIFIRQRDQIAYELAWRLWRRYISDNGTTADHLVLAQIILENDFKLWPVLKRMMASNAFYAPGSAETILKDPNTLYVSMARMSGMPVDNFSTMSNILANVGMRLGRPPTVFGFTYQNHQLASDVYQLSRFNGMVDHLLYQNLTNIRTNFNWTPHGGLVAGIPVTGNPSRDLANEVIKRLNLIDSWTPDQAAALEHMINFYLDNCNNQNDPTCFTNNGRRVKWYRNAPDLGDTDNDFYRLRQGYLLAATSAAFGTM